MNKALDAGRLQWVDAMRGFSMLIVVFGHVLLSMGIGGYDSFLSSVLLTFRMPLFFFVSGFFSFRAIEWWNRKRVGDILKRKFQAQILCTFVFVFVYQYVISGGVNLEHGFGGYWFTIVLFQMYICYLCFSLISRILRLNIVIPCLIVLSVIGIAALVVYSRDSHLWEFLCWENLCKYMQFFTLGIISARYRNKAFKLFGNNKFVVCVTIGWIVCMMLWYNIGVQQSYPILYSFVHDIAVRYFALMTVISFFYGYREHFSNLTRSNGALRFIGRRTLDIYMIHYFFIPDLSILGSWLQTGNRIIIQIIIASILTVAIVSMCLLISLMLRKSKILESWLFGVKPNVSPNSL